MELCFYYIKINQRTIQKAQKYPWFEKNKTKYNYHQRPLAWYFVYPILKSQKLNNFHLLLKKNPWTVHNDQLKGCNHSAQVARQENDLSQQGYIKRPTLKSEPSKNTTFFHNRGTWSDQIKRKIPGLILPTNGRGIGRMFHRGHKQKICVMRGAANVAGGTCNLPLKILASLIFVNLTQNLPTKG